MIIKSRIFRKFCVSYHKEASSLTSVNPKLYCFLGSFLTIFEIWRNIRRICLNFPFLLIPHKKIDTTPYKKMTLFSKYSRTVYVETYLICFNIFSMAGIFQCKSLAHCDNKSIELEQNVSYLANHFKKQKIMLSSKYVGELMS